MLTLEGIGVVAAGQQQGGSKPTADRAGTSDRLAQIVDDANNRVVPIIPEDVVELSTDVSTQNERRDPNVQANQQPEETENSYLFEEPQIIPREFDVTEEVRDHIEASKEVQARQAREEVIREIAANLATIS